MFRIVCDLKKGGMKIVENKETKKKTRQEGTSKMFSLPLRTERTDAEKLCLTGKNTMVIR